MIKSFTMLPCDRASKRGLKVVAKVGAIGDWAAYEAPYDWSDEEVASNGDKLSDREARELFPELESMPYRR